MAHRPVLEPVSHGSDSTNRTLSSPRLCSGYPTHFDPVLEQPFCKILILFSNTACSHRILPSCLTDYSHGASIGCQRARRPIQFVPRAVSKRVTNTSRIFNGPVLHVTFRACCLSSLPTYSTFYGCLVYLFLAHHLFLNFWHCYLALESNLSTNLAGNGHVQRAFSPVSCVLSVQETR